MSELRRDPTTGDWVIVAPERGKRPGASGSPSPTGSALPDRDPNCPFCPGNEERTPPALQMEPENGPWQVRVVSNLYAAVSGEVPPGGLLPDALLRDPVSPGAFLPSAVSPGAFLPGALPPGALAPGTAQDKGASTVDASALPALVKAPGAGAHEVIIETPLHNRHLADMAVPELARVLAVYRDRYRHLAQSPGIRYVALFRNHGREAGTSQLHPHAQAIALPVVPPAVAHRWAVAERHHQATARCLYCDLLATEERAGERWVFPSRAFPTPGGPGLSDPEGGAGQGSDPGQAFAAFCPFAPHHPHEVWVLPRRHAASFDSLDSAELHALAATLRAVLGAVRDAFGDPPLNLILHAGPASPAGPAGSGQGGNDAGQPDPQPHYHWHLQIAPRLARPGGFEVGTGMSIVPAAPEETAALLRQALGRAVEGS